MIMNMSFLVTPIFLAILHQHYRFIKVMYLMFAETCNIGAKPLRINQFQVNIFLIKKVTDSFVIDFYVTYLYFVLSILLLNVIKDVSDSTWQNPWTIFDSKHCKSFTGGSLPIHEYSAVESVKHTSYNRATLTHVHLRSLGR